MLHGQHLCSWDVVALDVMSGKILSSIRREGSVGFILTGTGRPRHLSCSLLNTYTVGRVKAVGTQCCRKYNRMVLCQAGRHVYYIRLLLQAADERNPLISLRFNPGLRQIC